MNSSARTIDPDAFEAQCNSICIALDMGFPLHLAKGPDRGKDIVTKVQLTGNKSSKLAKIHIECKYRKSSAVDTNSLINKFSWAMSDQVDIFIVMTNSRIASGVYDFIEATSTLRTFAIVIWDGEFISDLTNKLNKVSGLKKAKSYVYQMLIAALEHQNIESSSKLADGRLELPYFKETPLEYNVFVNRENERSILYNFDSYTSASLQGAPGIGKTILANNIAQEAVKQGFLTSTIKVDENNGHDIQQALVTISRLLANEFDDNVLLRHLYKYGWSYTEPAESLGIRSISDKKIFFIIEDLHQIKLNGALHRFIKSLTSNIGMAKVLLTTRTQTSINSMGVFPDIELALGGFTDDDVAKLCFELGVEKSQDTYYVSELNAKYKGWPLIIALACKQTNKRVIKDLDCSMVLDDFNSQEETLSMSLRAQLSSNAKTILDTIIYSKVQISVKELSLFMGLSIDELMKGWEELHILGIFTHMNIERQSTVLHEVLKSLFRSSSLLSNQLNHSWAEYLRMSNMHPDRLLAAISHFIDASDKSKAAEVLISSSDTLIRFGKNSELLTALSLINPEEVSEKNYIKLSFVESRVLETMGMYDKAKKCLELFTDKSILRRLPLLLKIQLNYYQSRNLYFLGQYDLCAALLEENLKHLETVEKIKGEYLVLKALSLSALARIKYTQRELDESELDYRSARELLEQEGSEIGTNKINHRLAMINLLRGNLDQAKIQFEHVRITSKRISDAKREAYSLHRLGEICRLKKKYDSAKDYHLKSLEIKLMMGHQRGLIFSRIELSRIAIEEGNHLEAEKNCKLALKHSVDLCLPKEEATTLHLMGYLEEIKGNKEESDQYYYMSIQCYKKLGLIHRAGLVVKRSHSSLLKYD